MKLFFAFIVCSLAPFVLAEFNDYYKPHTRCKCVNREFCSFKFSKLIEPRSPTQRCTHDQVCCKPEHIIPGGNSEHLGPGPVLQPPRPEQGSHAKCGQRTKISAYKRVVLPASYAALGEFPWQCAVLKNYTEGFVFLSSAVLIDPSVIVTTAHNLENIKAKDLLIRLGENNVQADPRRKFHHLNARVKKILIKEDFNKDTLVNDFAVLCLDKKVKCNEVVSPICLPQLNGPINDNQRCVVSGWGKGSYHGNYSTVLRKAYLNLVQFEKCQYLIRKRIQDPTFILDESFVCAGGELGKDACTGDAGGPLACPDKYGRQILTGLVSWGIGCGEKNVPGVYSDVREPGALKFILNAIKECNKPDLPPTTKGTTSTTTTTTTSTTTTTTTSKPPKPELEPEPELDPEPEFHEHPEESHESYDRPSNPRPRPSHNRPLNHRPSSYNHYQSQNRPAYELNPYN